ncbi:MAG: hypothetical protein CFE50_12895 [Pseudomonas sp. PGPPP4]|uniref:hypothetical protein n=1 Tax=Pseudomonas TaxID=286 RepID=UPI000BDD3EF5|nr:MULTISPECIES: hypothetical protein [Pseudomonas]MCI1011384.1 hypothetical protein [Pseudomonas oryzihabitans]OYT83283.1 MAG: hypothetical protein CFE50_12895 [Pseudomonas sp. PGPPP4]
MTYKNPLDTAAPLFTAAATTKAPLTAAPAKPAGISDGVTYYAFQSQPRLTLDINTAPEYVGFAKTFDAKGPHYAAASTLNELTLTGHWEGQLTRLDGHTRGATASDSTLDSSIAKLTVSLTDTADNQFHESDLITLDNFDGLQTFDGSKSTAGLSVDFINDYQHGAAIYSSQSAFLKNVTTGSGGDLIQVSTITAPELDSVASLANSRVKAITVDSGAGGDQIGAHIQQADVIINAGSGNDYVDLLFVKGVAAHNANLSGSFGHGATVTLGDGHDVLTVDPSLVNFDGSSTAAANRSLAANHVTVTDFKASDDIIVFGSAVYDEKAVVTIQDAALTKATSLFAALNTVAHSTTGLVNAAVFHYGQDTYVFRDAGTEGQVDNQDTLIQLVGVHNLEDVASTVSARERYEPGGTLGWG